MNSIFIKPATYAEEMGYPTYIIVFSIGFAALSLELLLGRTANNVLGAAYPAQLMTISLYLLGLSLGGLAAMTQKWASLMRLGPGALSMITIGLSFLPQPSPFATSLAVIATSFLCGATMSAWCGASSRPNLLYFLNGLGSALGAVAALFAPAALGLSRSYLSLGLLLLPSASLATAAATNKSSDQGRGSRVWLPVAATALIGLSSLITLLLECDYLRLAALIIGSSHIAMALVVAVMLCGLALGNWLGYRLKSIRPWVLPIFTLSIAASAAITAKLPAIFLGLRNLSGDDFLISRLLAAVLLTMPTATASGLIFPAFTRELRAQDQWRQAYFISCAGATLGPLLFYTLIETAIVVDILQGLLRAAAAAAALMAAFILRDTFTFARATVVFTSLVLLAAPSLPPAKLIAGLAWAPADRQFLLEAPLPLKFFKIGPVCTTSVEENESANLLYLKNDGKVEATIAKDLNRPSVGSDWSTQSLLAILPAALIDGPDKNGRSALIIGLGSGTTAGALLDEWCQCQKDGHKCKDTGKILVAELEPAVVEAAACFPGHDRLKEEIKIAIADGRNLLSPRSFDLIISQPAEPRLSSSAALYSRDFFSKAAASLKDHGVIAQWLQLYGFSKEELLIAVNTFTASFPHTAAFHQDGAGELILLGSTEPLALKKLAQGFFKPGRREKLARAGIDRLQSFTDCLVTEEQLKTWLAQSGPAAINSDDNLLLENGPLKYPQLSGEQMLRQNLAILPKRQIAESGQSKPDLNYCNEQIRLDGAAYCFLSHRAAILIANGRLDEALADLKRSIELYPSSAKSHELNAIALIFTGKLDLALQEAQAAHQIDQISYIPHAQAAIVYWAQGNREEARRTLNKAIQIAPESEILKDINEAFKAESTPASQGNTGILKSPLTKLLQILE